MKTIIHSVYNFFTPQVANNYRARLIQHDFLSLFLFIAVILALLQSSPAQKVLSFATDITIGTLYQLTNQERIENGLSTLTYNQTLANAACNKALDMFEKDYWAHTSPTGDLPWDFIASAGYAYQYAGENLAKGFAFSNGVLEGWNNSPTHKENILRPVYTDIGFCVKNGILQGEETTLVVQLFGTPITLAKKENITTNAQALELSDNKKAAITITPSLPPVITSTPVPKQIANTNTNSFIGTSTSTPSKNILSFISLNALSFNFGLVGFSLLTMVLLIDLYFAQKLKLSRFTGKNIAHGLFAIGGIIIILVLTKGGIL